MTISTIGPHVSSVTKRFAMMSAKRSKFPLAAMAVTLLLTACQNSIPSGSDTMPPVTGEPAVSITDKITQTSPPATAERLEQTKQMQIAQQAQDIKQALLNKNYQAIIPHIHPVKGVRFSMYAYVQPDSDKVFNRQQFAQYLKESRVKFTWGEKDGTGDIYITTLPDYLGTWVADDLNKAESVSYDQFQGSGNSLNNLKEKYPNADFVEFYSEGTEQYSGMDWRALRLVFEAYQGQYYLVAIVNDQWTI